MPDLAAKALEAPLLQNLGVSLPFPRSLAISLPYLSLPLHSSLPITHSTRPVPSRYTTLPMSASLETTKSHTSAKSTPQRAEVVQIGGDGITVEELTGHKRELKVQMGVWVSLFTYIVIILQIG